MSNITREDMIAAQKFAEAMNKYPAEVAVGIGIVLPKIVNGCSWGFVSKGNVEYEKVLESIKQNPNMDSFKVKGGYLYTMNMDYILGILSQTASGYLSKSDLEYASKNRQKALVALEKEMQKGRSQKIGIFNLNDSNTITVSGTSYKAYCVTLPDLLALCVRNGYNIGFSAGGRNAQLTPGQASSNKEKVVECLELAPSGNALFINIIKARK